MEPTAVAYRDSAPDQGRKSFFTSTEVDQKHLKKISLSLPDALVVSLEMERSSTGIRQGKNEFFHEDKSLRKRALSMEGTSWDV